MYLLAEDTTFLDLAKETDFFALIALICSMLIGLIGVIGGIGMVISRNRGREITKRELAAYVAEGSIEPDKAIAILNAGGKAWCKDNLNKK